MKEENKVIAEFMGVHVTPLGFMRNVMVKSYLLQELQYNTSWDWLILVVEKIESLGYSVSIERYLVQICEQKSTNLFGFINSTAESDSDTKLQLTYKAVVSFINYYNQTQKK